jgi:cation diffusion facilitator CzcD-associated flavoprotein CzcO
VGLKNNVSTRLLETTLNPFPAGTEDFVTHNVLREYIQATALITGVQKVTQYNTEVRKITKRDNLWTVDTAMLYVNNTGATTHKYASSVGSRPI